MQRKSVVRENPRLLAEIRPNPASAHGSVKSQRKFRSILAETKSMEKAIAAKIGSSLRC